MRKDAEISGDGNFLFRDFRACDALAVANARIPWAETIRLICESS
jgi:hypothetical protein